MNLVTIRNKVLISALPQKNLIKIYLMSKRKILIEPDPILRKKVKIEKVDDEVKKIIR